MSKQTLVRASVSCKYWTCPIGDTSLIGTDRFFGPSQQPRVDIGFMNQVEVDAGGHAILASLKDYEATVGKRTWAAVMKYSKELKGKNTKIAFFNSTPQGGGVALMRHALVRFLRLLNIDIKW